MRYALKVFLATGTICCFVGAFGHMFMVLVLGAAGRVDEAIAAGWTTVVLATVAAVGLLLTDEVGG